MSELPITIPTLLREKLDGGLGPEEIMGYRYTSGYWEEDDSSSDFPIRDFIEEPILQIYVADDKNDTLIRIEKKKLQQNAYAAFENLHQWLKENYGKGNTTKTNGVFGVVKENGKYQVELGRVIDYSSHCFHAGMMIEKITKLLPEGFGFIGDKNGWRWHWARHEDEGGASVFCEIIVGFSDDHRAYYHFDIWHDADNSQVNSSVQEKELDSACCSIARMLSDEYPDDLYQYVLVIARYVDFSTMEEMGRVEFDVPLNYDETKNLRRLLFSSEFFYPDNLRWQDKDLFLKIKDKAEALLSEAYGQPDPKLIVHIRMHWAEGERKRLIWGCSGLSEEDIQRMISYIDGLGDDAPSRKELLGRSRGSFVWKEVWTRETGHMWEKYTLLKRTPSDEELDYADCSQYAVWLSDLSTEAIVKLLKEYKS